MNVRSFPAHLFGGTHQWQRQTTNNSYLESAQKVDSGTQDPALWIKAMTLAEGDEEKARHRYIALRVEKLSNASATAPPEDPAPRIDSSDDVLYSKPDNPASQTSHPSTQDARVGSEDNTPSAEPSTSPSPKTAGEPISEDGNLHAGDAGPLESESDLVSRYGITFTGAQYHYQQYRYNKLSDAINYAELGRKKSIGAPPRSKSPSTPTIRTRQWSVFTHPIYRQEIVPHNDRKNWVAFFFTPIWHMATRTRHGVEILLALYGASLIWNFVLLPRISEDISTYPSDESFSLLRLSAVAVNIAVLFIWLFKANTFRQKSLEARGYKLEDIIEGRTKDEVLAKLKIK